MKTCVRGLCVFMILLAGCASAPVAQKAEMLLGRITRADLTESFMTAFEQPPVEPLFIEMIRQVHQGTEVLVFLGTWCPDSRRDVPRFLHIADAAGIEPDRYTLYGLDRAMASQEGMEKGYQIERVPTFIFLRAGKEIGRIVESPRTTLEGDILNILAAATSQKATVQKTSSRKTTSQRNG